MATHYLSGWQYCHGGVKRNAILPIGQYSGAGNIATEEGTLTCREAKIQVVANRGCSNFYSNSKAKDA